MINMVNVTKYTAKSVTKGRFIINLLLILRLVNVINIKISIWITKNVTRYHVICNRGSSQLKWKTHFTVSLPSWIR